MYEINSEICLSNPNAVQKTKKDARHKLIVNYKIASQIKAENAPKWHTIYGIREVTEKDEIDIWI